MANATDERDDVPLKLRLSGVQLDESTRAWITQRSQRRFGKLAGHIERMSVRLKDVNGPRGGVDQLCRIKVTLHGLPSAVVEQRAATSMAAFDLASSGVLRSVKRSVGKAATLYPARRGKVVAQRVRGPLPAARPAVPSARGEGSLYDRRVGRHADNLERVVVRPEKKRGDALVDTSLPGVSASDRKVGLRGTATRNTKRRTKGMTASLEDSVPGKRPSRKSTRRSQNRAKSGSKLQRRATRKVTSPKARATRARRGGGL